MLFCRCDTVAVAHAGLSLAAFGVWAQVFVEYTDVAGSQKAKQSLNGRKFGGNSVVAIYYPEDRFARGDYVGQ